MKAINVSLHILLLLVATNFAAALIPWLWKFDLLISLRTERSPTRNATTNNTTDVSAQPYEHAADAAKLIEVVMSIL